MFEQNQNNSSDHPSEFCRWQEVDKVPPRGMELTITANAAECSAVAKRLDLLELKALSAILTIERLADSDAYQVKGKLTAQVVQQCVATLMPVPATVIETVSGSFMPSAHIPAEHGSLEIADVLEEIIEPIINGSIDVGELVVQHLALGLDPYPRRKDTKILSPKAAPVGKDTQKPFAGLVDLLKEKEKNNKK
jgi:uncharacterized metal-binding protein YceD (DUF177 family)